MSFNVNRNSIPFADCDEVDDDDLMTESQENLARLQSTSGLSRKKSLGERRNKDVNLTVIVENKMNNKVERLNNTSDCENIDIPKKAVGLRRNSISMPVLNVDDMEALRQAHMDHAANRVMPDDFESICCSIDDTSISQNSLKQDTGSKPTITIDDMSEDEEQESLQRRGFFRNKRKLSIAPLPALRLNDKEMMANEFDVNSVMSNQASITSINSLASLLKEKMQMFPAMIRKKKKATKDYKIRVFVGMLFLIIVFLIGYAYVTYNQQILTRSYFQHVKIHEVTRRLRIFDSKGVDYITGMMGTTINMDTKYHCLNQDEKDDGSMCWEWNGRSRLYMNYKEPPVTDIRCYTFHWQALIDDLYPTDCFDIGEEKGFWYGAGLTKRADYPIDQASFDFAPFITGDIDTKQFGNAVRRYFINSKGVAIIVDENTPLYISINQSTEQFCLQARFNDFSYANRQTEYPELNYTICTAPLQTLHNGLTQKSLWDGLKQTDVNVIHSLLEEPVWQIPVEKAALFTQETIHNYTEDIIALGYLRLGHVLINEFWQKHIGDFTLDEERFPSFEDTVTVLHRRGFRISFMIQPFISTESPNFMESVLNRLFVTESDSEENVPALSQYKSVMSAGVMDILNNATIPWLLEKLDKVIKTYQIDSFYIDFGTAYNMPRHYKLSSSLYNPDEYKTLFTKSLEENINIIGVSGAVSVPRPPAFLSMPPMNSSWSGLKKIIPLMLNYGIIGFPFIMPGPVGGDLTNATVLPEKDLYIRWLQLATFLPVLRFTHLPSEYKNDLVTDVAKELTAIRQKTVMPLLKNFTRIAMNEGLPLIRPLWMLDPNDSNCLSIKDEFSVGDQLIVAPILQKDETFREVYLPQGVWKDGIDGSIRKGSRWIHHYRVPAEKVAYFVKMPDNTLF